MQTWQLSPTIVRQRVFFANALVARRVVSPHGIYKFVAERCDGVPMSWVQHWVLEDNAILGNVVAKSVIGYDKGELSGTPPTDENEVGSDHGRVIAR